MSTPAGLGYADIKPGLDEVVQGLRAVYGQRLTRLVLCGSYARDEAHAESDGIGAAPT
ncbi:MAG TPA: nucleotidyltransferase domain-containing protein [Meiothermus sp.]|nr:nucleotidyltransferase domain-containing protein [Meiothermus sp.]